MNGTWDDFIGVQWTPEEFKEWHEQGRTEGRYPNWTLKDHVKRIVDSVFNDDDWWWIDKEHRGTLRMAYSDRESVIDEIMRCLE